MNRNYEDLVQAIVVRAAKDYKKVLRVLIRRPRKQVALDLKSDIEEFFLSQWFRDLTSVNGEYIITELQKEVNF